MTFLNHHNNLLILTILLLTLLLRKPCRTLTPRLTENDNCKNLLNNLCDGLEKFLGFHPSSKGYDGQGIVYSDLDRLCDGVMGFLFEIISEVNNNENLKKYNTELPKTLNKIKQALYNGREKFNTHMPLVSQGVARWLKEVNEKHQSVITPLEHLLRLVNNHMSIDMSAIIVTEQLHNWQGFSSLYVEKIIEAEKALHNVDENLEIKLAPKLDLIKQVAQNFWSSVIDRSVTNSVETLYNKLTSIPQTLTKRISAKTQTVQSTLNVKFDKIAANIENFKKIKNSQIQSINSAVSAANQHIVELIGDSQNGFDTNYKNQISKRFTALRNEIERFVKKDSGNTTELLKQFEMVTNGIRELQVNVQGDLQKLKNDITALADTVYSDDRNPLVNDALTQLKNDMETLRNTTAAITAKSDSLQRQYTESCKETIDIFANQYGKLRESIYGPGSKSVTDIKKGSIAHLVTELIDAIGAVDVGILDSAVTKFHGDVTQRIKDAADKAVEKAADQFKMKGDGEAQIDVTSIMVLFDGAKTALDQAASSVNVQLEALKEVPGVVEESRQGADTLMDKLKGELDVLQYQIKAIEEPVNAANAVLDAAISQLQTSLQDAQSTANVTMSLLRSDLQATTNKAFNDLEEHVQKMFAEQKKAELRAVYTSVSNQLSSIKSNIVDDMDTGIKGLMGKLKQTFEERRVYPSDTEMNIFADKLASFFAKFLEEVTWQRDVSSYRDRLTPLIAALSALLSTMHEHRHFSATVSTKLADLHAQLDTLTPAKFAEASPLLNVVKAGVRAFHGELAKQYVSRYSGVEVGEMVKEDKITAYGTKLSKVFLTSLTTLCDDLNPLKKYSGSTWRQDKIYKDTSIGYFLARRGYEVNSEKDKQTGELQDKPGMIGFHIFKFLDKPRGSDNEHLKKCKEEGNEHDEKVTTAATKSPFGVVGILNCLFRHLHQYYTACHLRHIERPKSPSSVYQMLVWLTGLSHNRVFSKVSVSDIGDLFEKPDEDSGEGNPDGLPVLLKDPDTLPAYPQAIAASTLTSTIQKVCVAAEDVLTSILGHGHADGIYAVDFNTNPDGFAYPTAPGACFDMLCDVLNRLYLQLFFLYGQCSNEEPSVSWRDCWYGNQVGGSAWNCNAMQCPNQKGNQIHKQRCNQKCDQTAQCGIKSPLQSFLEDGLPGFLPHSFTKPGCKLTCTLSNHRGIPCRTPMGFNDISVTASHRQRGEYLKKALEGFCGSDSAPLTKLCAQLTCLLQKPPQTLGDIFAFYYGYLGGWAADFYGNFGKSNPHTQAAFKQAVNDAYFGEQYGHLDPTSLVSSSKHGDEHSKGNLCSIANCESGSVAPCGLYVKSMTQDITRYYSAEHKANHLSWIVYITETFCDLLKKLYDDCCKKCGPGGSKCHVKSCAEQCEIKYSDDKQKMKLLKDKSHKLECKSIVTCRDTHPTLYRYGFTFGHPWGLNGSGNNERANRTC
ncbi:hypothetical protein, conserved [Babesia bigemina]|uniref:C3H1-type domain-containing protein n=1 Tax=Babesia bigemina TaxID=5866 RepID=A0A061BJE4_BABBI|nr:hypothetical protein, conserved [Babesia bigemina]CDR71594.1 hypothetical protein, conserved [Babesia bigemina]|eukprot:XP_012770541.1 hypothetical protein, conserved [Babesia bigemina]